MYISGLSPPFLLLQKDFDTFRSLPFGVFLCDYDNRYLSLIYIQIIECESITINLQMIKLFYVNTLSLKRFVAPVT